MVRAGAPRPPSQALPHIQSGTTGMELQSKTNQITLPKSHSDHQGLWHVWAKMAPSNRLPQPVAWMGF